MDFNLPGGYTLVFYFVDELPSTKKPCTSHPVPLSDGFKKISLAFLGPLLRCKILKMKYFRNQSCKSKNVLVVDVIYFLFRNNNSNCGNWYEMDLQRI